MTQEKLNRAKSIQVQIDEFESANKCFWYPDFNGDGRRVSTNPQFLIEFNNHYENSRSQIKIPSVLSQKLIELIQEAIDENLLELKAELERL